MRTKRYLAALLAVALVIGLCGAALAASNTCRYSGTGEHSWGGWEIQTEATCIRAGTRVRRCQNGSCREYQEQTYYAAHSYGPWTLAVEPTDHSAGERRRVCQVCGDTQSETVYPDGTLRRGDRGDDVTALQNELVCYGVLDEDGVDGKYGPGTAAAVSAVQAAEGLTEDGIAWPQTQAYLGHQFGAWETITEATDFSAGLQAHECERCGYKEEETVYPTPIYFPGDKGEGVLALQQALNDAGYNCGAPDGSYGQKTAAAVSAIEADNGVEPDGIAWPGVLKWLGVEGAGGPSISLMHLPPPALPLIGLSIDPIAPQHFTLGDSVPAHCSITNLTDHMLVIDKYSFGRETDSINHEDWMDADPVILFPHATRSFTADIVFDDVDCNNTWIRRSLTAEGHLLDSGEISPTVECEVNVVAVLDEPAIFVKFDKLPEHFGTPGGPVSLTMTVYNNGSADVRVVERALRSCNGLVEPDDYTMVVPPEYYDIFKAGDIFQVVVETTIDEHDIAYAAQEGRDGKTDRVGIIYAVPIDDPDKELRRGDFVDIGLVDGSVYEPDEAAIRLEVIPEREGMYAAVGDTMRFTVRLYNDTDVALVDPLVQSLNRDDSLRLNESAAALPAHDYIEFTDEYTFTQEDAEPDAFLLWWMGAAAMADGTPVSANPIRLKYSVSGNESGEVAIVKSEVSERPSPYGYTEGDVVGYDITVTNDTDERLTDVRVYDELNGPADESLVQTFDALEPGESRTAHYDHTVTYEEAASSTILNTAHVDWLIPGGERAGDDSNMVTVPTWLSAGEDRPDMTKVVTNLPDRGYFVKGETIDFIITITNDTEGDIVEARLYDWLEETEDRLIDEYAVIPAGETRTRHYLYVVTEEDVAYPDIVNVAYLEYKMTTRTHGPSLIAGEAGERTVTREMEPLYARVRAPLGSMPDVTTPPPVTDPPVTVPPTTEPPVTNPPITVPPTTEPPVTNPPVTVPPTTQPPVTPAPGHGPICCVRTLVGLGEGVSQYTLDYCDEHEPLREMVESLVRRASTDEDKLAAWEQAVMIWTDALNEEYDRLIAGRPDAERAVIMNEKALFFAQLACLRDMLTSLMPDDPAGVAMRISEQLMNRTTDLCYENHMAPAQRTDSVMGEHASLPAAATTADCVRTIDEVTPGGVRYTETLCGAHRATESGALELIGSLPDQAKAWGMARTLWLAEVNGLYDDMYMAADEDGQRQILTSRLIFLKWLDEREKELEMLYPERGEIVQEVLAQTLRARVIDLCPDAGA